MMAVPCITSVYGHAETECTIKKSRFIVTLQEITDEKEAGRFIERLRKQYWDASHNCYAYQIGSTGMVQKYSDAGEPAGTAGRPMLETLKKKGITNTIVIVTRYFGGIKLGAGGLIRTYSHVVSLGLDAADIADYTPYDIVTVRSTYASVSLLERIALDYHIIIAGRDFSDTVLFTLHIPQSQTVTIKTILADATNGSAQYELLGMKTIPILRPKTQSDS